MRSTLTILFGCFLLAGCGSNPPEQRYVEGVVRRNATARNTGSDANIRNIQKAIDSYYSDNTSCPPAADYAMLSSYLCPTYMTVLPNRDSWGFPYRYHTDGRSYTLSSVGSDGQEGTADDIIVRGGE